MTVYALLLAIERRFTDEKLKELGFSKTTIWRIKKRWDDADSELKYKEKMIKRV
jgi:hypothetical protein